MRRAVSSSPAIFGPLAGLFFIGLFVLPVEAQDSAPTAVPPILKIDSNIAAGDPVDPKLKDPFKTHPFKLAPGVIYKFDVTSTEIDPYFRLVDSDGKVLAEDDDSGGRQNSRLFYRADTASDVRLVVIALGVRLGAYQIAVRPGTQKQFDEHVQLQQWHAIVNGAYSAQMKGNSDKALKDLDEALELARKLYPKADYPNGHPRIIDSFVFRGRAFHHRRQFAESEQAYRQALALRRDLYPVDRFPEGHIDIVEGLLQVGASLQERKLPAEGEPFIVNGWSMYRKLYPPGKYPDDNADLPRLMSRIAGNYRKRDEFARSEMFHREAVGIDRILLPRMVNPLGNEDLITTLNNLGEVLVQLRRFTEAEEVFRDKLKMSEALYPRSKFPTGHASVVGAHRSLGIALSDSGNFGAAEKVYRETLTLARELYSQKKFPKGHPAIVSALNDLAFVVQARGNSGEAEALYREALAMQRTLTPSPSEEEIRGLTSLGVALRRQGAYAEAEACYLEALTMCEQLYPKERFPNGHEKTLSVLTNLGVTLRSKGEAAKTERIDRDVLKMSEALYPKEKYPLGHPSIARALNNMAFGFSVRGAHAQAESHYRRALKMKEDLYLRSQFPRGHEHLVETLNNLGAVLLRQGAMEEAERYHREALRMCEQLYPKAEYPNGHPRMAHAINYVASVLAHQDRHAEAEPYHKAGLAMLEGIYPKSRYPRGHTEIVSTLDNLSRDAESLGNAALAEELARDSLKMARDLYPVNEYPLGHEVLVRHLNNLGARLVGRGKPDEAEKLYYLAAEMSQKLGLTNRENILYNLATINRDRGQLDVAEKYAVASVEAFRLARQRIGFSGLERVAFTAQNSKWPELAAIRIARENPRGAWEAYEQHLGQGLLDDLVGKSARVLKDDQRAREEKLTARLAFLDRRIDELIDGKAPAEKIDPLRKERDALTVDWAQSQAELEAKYGPVVGQVYSLKTIQAQLPPGTAFIGWLDFPPNKTSRGPDREHFGFVLRAEGDPVWVRLPVFDQEQGWTEKDDRLTGDFRAALRQYDADVDWKELRTDVVRQRFEPLEPHLKGIKRLVVLPSMWMAGIPVEVLTDRHHVSYAPSATLHSWLRENRPEPAKADLLAVGDSIFSAQEVKEARDKLVLALRNERFRPLPGSAKEIEAIRRLVGVDKAQDRVRVLIGKDATLDNLQQLAASKRLSDYRYLHIATHGKALPDSGLNSYLALTADADTGLDYMKLTASEIRRTWRLNADVVTLSACQTALGQQRRGEGYVGFSQALLISGARTLVLSQWNVSDHAASLMMIRFYENLTGRREGLKEPMGKLESLEEARRWLRDLSREEALQRLQGTPEEWLQGLPRGQRPFSHPSFWAPFILVGDPGG